MLIGGRLAHLAALGLITTYAVFTVWYTLSSGLNHTCVYATVQLDNPNATTATWGVYNATVVYAYPEAGARRFSDGLSGFDHVCRDSWINETSLDVLRTMKGLREKVRIVLGTRNCHAYLWNVHLRMIAAAWLLYVAFMSLRQERRLLGPFRDQNEFLPPTGYTLNYATYAIANTVLGTHYTKVARLLCEAALRRTALSRKLKTDPLGFLCESPCAAVLMGLEYAVHFLARLVAVGTVSLVHTPCAQTYPLYVKIASWTFVVAMTALEAVAILYNKPTKGVDYDQHPPQHASGLRGVLVSCCSAVLANLFIKMVYLLAIVGAVAILLHYEHRIQISLLGQRLPVPG
ncbi:envelope glycoprotein K [Equid alphaherpesvirus 3]|uniref:Envelope glycoprotein K n=1 Tax=Equid alphaherpesvirus 3 TaxID=80341 RepID=A0A077BCH9_9ALPH|nr:envelope glycoprotein K [Equid alphaherpesvirus 3]AIL02923.1 envelope glycoprotein K [Equid alphaherpesvirus 3]